LGFDLPPRSLRLFVRNAFFLHYIASLLSKFEEEKLLLSIKKPPEWVAKKIREDYRGIEETTSSSFTISSGKSGKTSPFGRLFDLDTEPIEIDFFPFVRVGGAASTNQTQTNKDLNAGGLAMDVVAA